MCGERAVLFAQMSHRCKLHMWDMRAVLFAVGDFLGRAVAGRGPWANGLPEPLSVLLYSVLR